MNVVFSTALRWVLVACGIAILWVAFFKLNMQLFSLAAYSENAHWVFLPAALRIIVVLLLGIRGAIGLMGGAYFTLSQELQDTWPVGVAVSISSGLAPLVAIGLCRKFFAINSDLKGLRGYHIAALSVVNATCNAVFLNSVMLAAGREEAGITLATTIFVGDLLGSAVTLFVLSAAISAVIHVQRMRCR
jgi:hypothetical protein